MSTKFEMVAAGALALNQVSLVYSVEANAIHTWQVVSPGSNFSGTVVIQASFDGGVTWSACATSTDTFSSNITAPGFAAPPVSPCALVLVRWKLTAFVSGTLRIFYQGIRNL